MIFVPGLAAWNWAIMLSKTALSSARQWWNSIAPGGAVNAPTGCLPLELSLTRAQRRTPVASFWQMRDVDVVPVLTPSLVHLAPSAGVSAALTATSGDAIKPRASAATATRRNAPFLFVFIILVIASIIFEIRMVFTIR